MSDITKSDGLSMDVNSAIKAPYVSGLTAGSAIPAAAPCYIDSDGVVQLAVTSVKTSGSLAFYVGFSPKAYALGEAMSLYGKGARFDYGTSLTPGAYLWLSSTAGALTDTEDTNNPPVCVAINSTDVVVLR